MKTPIQEIITELSHRINDTPMNNVQFRRIRGVYTDALQIVKSHLGDEKEHIEKAWINKDYITDFEDYYNLTYKQ